MVYIYVLLLQKQKYYIGKTTDLQYRIETHYKLGGAAFTKRYRPVKVLKQIPNCSDHDEQRITQEYMAKYGIQNVRGGPWTQILLSDAQEECIQQILDSEADACYICGEQGHFVKECPQKKQGHKVKASMPQTPETQKKARVIAYPCQFCGKDFDSKHGCSYHENTHCYKRKSKSTNTKYNANYQENYDPGEDLWEELNESDSESDDGDSEVSCYRCGHSGHYAPACYAKRNIDGYLIR
jgi:predicted GIY-YIG superfamily endonuclease